MTHPSYQGNFRLNIFQNLFLPCDITIAWPASELFMLMLPMSQLIDHWIPVMIQIFIGWKILYNEYKIYIILKYRYILSTWNPEAVCRMTHYMTPGTNADQDIINVYITMAYCQDTKCFRSYRIYFLKTCLRCKHPLDQQLNCRKTFSRSNRENFPNDLNHQSTWQI